MDKQTVVLGDNTQAEALRIAEKYLSSKGWRFGPSEIGKTAGEILTALHLALPQAPKVQP
jgi:hypothetical protein